MEQLNKLISKYQNKISRLKEISSRLPHNDSVLEAERDVYQLVTNDLEQLIKRTIVMTILERAVKREKELFKLGFKFIESEYIYRLIFEKELIKIEFNRLIDFDEENWSLYLKRKTLFIK